MNMLLGNIFGFGNPVELGIIAAVVLVLFGGSKLAGFGKSAGEALKEFKKATHEEEELPVVKAVDVEPAVSPAAIPPAQTVSSTKE